MNALYQDLLNQDINNVQIIAIGKGQYSSDNSNWTDDNTIPVVNDPSPNDTWTNWDASQWDLFFLDPTGNYAEYFNINTWDYVKIYNSIINIISGYTDFEDANYDPDATIDDGSCALAIETPIFPNQYSITSIYPNPFNPTTTISYELPENSIVRITIYNVQGREIKVLVNQYQEAGYKSVRWNATNNYGKPISAGMYFYKIRAGEFTQTRKMLLLK